MAASVFIQAQTRIGKSLSLTHLPPLRDTLPNGPVAMKRILIQGAEVVTVDPDLGVVDNCDILIENNI